MENLEKTKNNLDSENIHKLFFINHYIEILKRTGVGNMSTIKTNFTKEIIEKYKNGENIFEKLNYIIEMCSENNKLVPNLPAKIQNDYIVSELSNKNINMYDVGYYDGEDKYSCEYSLAYNNGKEKNAFSITIHSFKISEVFLTLWDNNESINNILKTVIGKKEPEDLIKQDLTAGGIKFSFLDEEDKLFDLVIKLKKAFDEFCNS